MPFEVDVVSCVHLNILRNVRKSEIFELVADSVGQVLETLISFVDELCDVRSVKFLVSDFKQGVPQKS